MTDNVKNYGEVLMMNAPRLIYPPMEAMLAVDFVLSNFNSNAWAKAKLCGQYRKIINPCYHRIWKPFFEAMYKVVDVNFDEQNKNVGLLFPIGN